MGLDDGLFQFSKLNRNADNLDSQPDGTGSRLADRGTTRPGKGTTQTGQPIQTVLPAFDGMVKGKCGVSTGNAKTQAKCKMAERGGIRTPDTISRSRYSKTLILQANMIDMTPLNVIPCRYTFYV